MTRIRVRIGALVLEQFALSRADQAKMGRLVETHLEQLLVANNPPSGRNRGGGLAGRVSPPAAKQPSQAETASAIARGIHQTILSKS